MSTAISIEIYRSIEQAGCKINLIFIEDPTGALHCCILAA